jgi:hypothetical protein
MPEPSTPRWLNKEQTCAYLGGFSMKQLERLMQKSTLRASYTLGPKSPRFDVRELDRWMSEGQQQETPAEKPGMRLAAG